MRALSSLRVACTAAAALRGRYTAPGFHASSASSPSTATSASTAPSSSPSPPSTAHGHPRGAARPSAVTRGRAKDRLPPVPTDLADPRRRLAVLIDGSNPNLIPTSCTTASQICQTSPLFTTVLPAVMEVGVPVLLRVFAHQLPAVWGPLLAGNGGAAASTPSPSSASPLSAPGLSAPTATVPPMQLEHFRVEGFIPIAMQMEADARHLYELRALNKVEGVCYVCHEADHAVYTSLMDEQRTASAELAKLLLQTNRDKKSSSFTHAQPPQEGSADDGVAVASFFNQYVFDELGAVGESAVDGRSKNGA